MGTKYYTAYQNAEESSSGVVELTKDEYRAVANFLNQVRGFASGYCGNCGIGNIPYDTAEDAQATLYKEDCDEE